MSYTRDSFDTNFGPTDVLPTTCLKCGASKQLTTAETLDWMKIHPSQCRVTTELCGLDACEMTGECQARSGCDYSGESND